MSGLLNALIKLGDSLGKFSQHEKTPQPKNMKTIKIIDNRKTVYINYNDVEQLQTKQTRGEALTLKDLILYIIISGLWERILADAREFKRLNPYTIECRERPSGAKEYFLQYYFPLFDDGKMIGSSVVHLLHISMCNKLNEGVSIFGPDLIALLWEIEYDFVYECLNNPSLKEENNIHYYDAEEPTNYNPEGKYYFFPNTQEKERLQELCNLCYSFRGQSGACQHGCEAYIKSWPNPEYNITPFILKCDEEIQNEIVSLTDDDYFLMKSNIPSLRDMCKDLDDKPRRRRVPQTIEEEPEEE